MAAEGWEEKEICTKGVGDGQEYGERWRLGEWGGGGGVNFPAPPPRYYLHLQIKCKYGRLNKRPRAS